MKSRNRGRGSPSPSRKKILITGITGQDGSYLAELLLDRGDEVHGLMRRSSAPNTQRIDHIWDRLTMHYGDIGGESLGPLIREHQFAEIYHLAAMSHVKVSFDLPMATTQIGAMGSLDLFESVRRFSPQSRVYNAASSEMFGGSPAPQSESTPFMPLSPYAAAKVHAYHMAKIYRQAYGLFIANGILFNHESERRGINFVTRKITRAIAAIKRGEQDKIVLGKIYTERDWGYAPDFVRAMPMMLAQKLPGDFVIGTGQTRTVFEFLVAACDYAGLDWREHLVKNDPKYMRPLDVQKLQADARKARRVLGWRPTVPFTELVRRMVDADLQSGA